MRCITFPNNSLPSYYIANGRWAALDQRMRIHSWVKSCQCIQLNGRFWKPAVKMYYLTVLHFNNEYSIGRHGYKMKIYIIMSNYGGKTRLNNNSTTLKKKLFPACARFGSDSRLYIKQPQKGKRTHAFKILLFAAET